MITQRDFRKFQCRYHRNGVAGNGFYLCSFLFRVGNKFEPLRAVVFDGDMPFTAVMSESDIDQRWRGDKFYEPLVRAIDACRDAHGVTL